MSRKLKVINPTVDKRWDEFVLANSLATVYHHSAWAEVIQSTYNYDSFYVALESSVTGQIEGIFPFMLIESRLTGRRLVCLPFTAYCNPLMPPGEIENVIEFALEHHPDIDYVEFRFCDSVSQEPKKRFHHQQSFVTHILNLDPDLEQLFKIFHPTSVRQRIKRAEKNKLTFRYGSEEDDLKKFYELETAVRKKHGLPPQPYKFFANAWKVLKPKNLLYLPLVEYKSKIIAAAIVLKFKKTFYFEYSASDQDFLNLCPNHMLIWETIKKAKEEGSSHFDFGRSPLKHHSLIEFKQRWGAEKHFLDYYYFPEAKKIISEDGLGRKAACWVNKLLPSRLLQLESKFLYPHLG